MVTEGGQGIEGLAVQVAGLFARLLQPQQGRVGGLVPGDIGAQWELYLKGQNLLNEDIRNSTSFLKDQAPQIGRNFVLGLRMRY